MRNNKGRVICVLCTLALLWSMILPAMSTTVSGEGTNGEIFDTMNPEDILVSLDYHDFVLPYGADVGDAVVADTESVTGFAAKLSYAGRASSGDEGLMQSMILSSGQRLEINMNAPAPGSIVTFGKITASELKTNAQKGGYNLYKFDDVTPLPASGEGRNFIYMFDCWGFQATVDAYKDVLLGKKVDVYLSMKVTGNIANTTDNSPAYYIDRIIFTSANPRMLVHGDQCVFANYVHQGDAGMGTPATPPSSVAELTEKAEASDILAKFDYQSFSLPYGAAYGDKIVPDSESSTGQAATLSYAARSGETGLANAMIINDPNTLKLYTYSTGIWVAPIGELTAAQLQANAQNGGYTLYKFDNVNIMPAAAASGNMLYLFDCQGFRAPLDSYKSVLEGQLVDVYLSLRVTGDVTNTTDNTPSYYIDNLVITKSDAMEEDQMNAGTMVGTCIYKCGKTNTISANAAHVKIFGASSFTFAYGDAFADKIVTDSDSDMGSAVQYAAYPRRNEATNHLIMGTIPFITYGPSAMDSIGELYGAELKVNQGYQVYKFSHDSFTIADDASIVFLFNDWGLQNPALLTALKSYKGKAIDIFLSMKITGDIYGENLSMDSEDNWPVYYIDKLIIAERCSFGEFISNNNATCGADGTKSSSCTVCGMTGYALDSGTATGLHDFTSEIVEDKYCKHTATCGKAAVYYKSCTVCGLSSIGQTGEATFEHGEALTHKFSSYVNDNNATCTADGTKHRSCSICGRVETVTVKGTMLEHSYHEKASEQVATEATCDSPALYFVQCDNCDAVSDALTVASGDVKAHSYGAWTDTADGSNHSHSCTACDQMETQPHTWDAGETTKAPTTEEEGEKLYTCTDCGATKKEVLKKLSGNQGSNAPSYSHDSEPQNSNNEIILLILSSLCLATSIVAAVLLLKKKK